MTRQRAGLDISYISLAFLLIYSRCKSLILNKKLITRSQNVSDKCYLVGFCLTRFRILSFFPHSLSALRVNIFPSRALETNNLEYYWRDAKILIWRFWQGSRDKQLWTLLKRCENNMWKPLDACLFTLSWNYPLFAVSTPCVYLHAFHFRNVNMIYSWIIGGGTISDHLNIESCWGCGNMPVMFFVVLCN